MIEDLHFTYCKRELVHKFLISSTRKIQMTMKLIDPERKKTISIIDFAKKVNIDYTKFVFEQADLQSQIPYIKND